jgi:Ran GTPase-activating protein (RanGAP) involved in mRNA processing and transport
MDYFCDKIIEKSNSKNYLKYLEKLILRGNSFNYKILNKFFSAIKLLKNLNYLNVNQTVLEPEHMNLIHEFLLNLNKNWKFNDCGGVFEKIETYEIEEDKNDIQIIKKTKKEKFKANQKKIKNIKTLKLTFLNFKWLQIKIKEFEHLETLILSECNIKNDDLISLSQIFSQMPLIINLNLSSNNFSSKGLESFSNNLHFLTNLYELNLSDNFINDEGMSIININIAKLENIQNLIFSFNNISQISFSEFLIKMRDHQQLQFIDFYGNLIKDNGLNTLSDEIKNNGFKILKKINLGNNFIGNDSMKKLSEIIKKCNNLSEIILCDNNITQEGLLCFQDIFSNLINQITKFDLRNNDITKDFKNNLKLLGTPNNYLF